jgi:hypothetical protein
MGSKQRHDDKAFSNNYNYYWPTVDYPIYYYVDPTGHLPLAPHSGEKRKERDSSREKDRKRIQRIESSSEREWWWARPRADGDLFSGLVETDLWQVPAACTWMKTGAPRKGSIDKRLEKWIDRMKMTNIVEVKIDFEEKMIKFMDTEGSLLGFKIFPMLRHRRRKGDKKPNVILLNKHSPTQPDLWGNIVGYDTVDLLTVDMPDEENKLDWTSPYGFRFEPINEACPYFKNAPIFKEGKIEAMEVDYINSTLKFFAKGKDEAVKEYDLLLGVHSCPDLSPTKPNINMNEKIYLGVNGDFVVNP